MAIGPQTHIGAVRLRVAELEATRAFYERVVGLTTLSHGADRADLGPPCGPALVELMAAPDAPHRPPGTTGLFHLAVLVPDRPELAKSLRRIAAAGHPLSGASDHLVSESLYLRDPEGNGIEVYRDRPRSEWTHDADGALQMATLPLDVDGLLSEDGAGEEPPPEVPGGTTIGHVHLNVADIPATEAFYAGRLGLEVTVRGYPGALFLAAGGYHHHLGTNTWNGEGAPEPPPGALGLDWFELVVAENDEADRIGERFDAAGGPPVERRREGILARDPAGNGVLIRGSR